MEGDNQFILYMILKWETLPTLSDGWLTLDNMLQQQNWQYISTILTICLFNNSNRNGSLVYNMSQSKAGLDIWNLIFKTHKEANNYWCLMQCCTI